MSSTTDPKTVVIESFQIIATGDEQLARHIIAPGFINHEADDDPGDHDRQLTGPAGFLATGTWLREAFSSLHFEHEETAADGGTVLAATLMTGRHTGAFQGIEPTGRPFTQKQVHIFSIAYGQITSHRAVRDDLGLLFQLGWKPGNRPG